jgi:hypothetical protein
MKHLLLILFIITTFSSIAQQNVKSDDILVKENTSYLIKDCTQTYDFLCAPFSSQASIQVASEQAIWHDTLIVASVTDSTILFKDTLGIIAQDGIYNSRLVTVLTGDDADTVMAITDFVADSLCAFVASTPSSLAEDVKVSITGYNKTRYVLQKSTDQKYWWSIDSIIVGTADRQDTAKLDMTDIYMPYIRVRAEAYDSVQSISNQITILIKK